MIQRIEALIAAVALALTLGFGAGYHYKGQADQANVVKQATTALKKAGTSIVQSTEKSQQVEASIQHSDNEIDQLNKAAQVRLKGKIYEPSIRTGSNPGDARGAINVVSTAAGATSLAQLPDGAGNCGDGRLDLGTVRLLNRARDDTAMESAAGSAR